MKAGVKPAQLAPPYAEAHTAACAIAVSQVFAPAFCKPCVCQA